MSLSEHTLAQHLDDPAVLCCRRPAGTVISAEDVEDPSIFADLEEAELLSLSSSGLSIREALGRPLLAETDALVPLTPELLGPAPAGVGAPSAQASAGVGADQEHPDNGEITVSRRRRRITHTLVRREYPVTQVQIGQDTSYRDGTLTIDVASIEEAAQSQDLVHSVTLDVIEASNRHVYTNTIMDVMPIAAKAEGIVGTGVTNALTGVVVILTGVDENGVQIHEFGSCEGYLDEKVAFGRPGAPDADELIIRVNVVLAAGVGMERRGPLAAHEACDVILAGIREELATMDAQPERELVFTDSHDPEAPRVVLVKEIMGQGAMHDNVIMPTEPAGVHGGRKNVDLGNVPIVLSANEVRDGGIHALTCIGPATKETTRHYWREPLVAALADDPELNLVGVVFIGSPQVNDEKQYVSERLGALVETMDLDGAIVTTEGFGNNHIDFAGNIAALGSRDIPVVGVTFAAYQGALVVGNEYMDAMVELNKDPDGFENEQLSCSSICPEDARRALALLKAKMAGVPIASAPRRWSPDVVAANQERVDALAGAASIPATEGVRA